MSLELLERLLNVDVEIDIEAQDIAGIHLAPGEEYTATLKVKFIGREPRY